MTTKRELIDTKTLPSVKKQESKASTFFISASIPNTLDAAGYKSIAYTPIKKTIPKR